MRGILATFARELRAYFFSPLAYVVLCFFLLVNGFIFWAIVNFLNDPTAPAGRPLDIFFGQTVYFWVVLLFVGPVLTMRLLSEERRSGSIEILMTAPVNEAQVVLGKYLAALAFYVFLWLPTVVYALIIAYYTEVDWGPVAAGYLGIVGLGAMFLAIGIFASAMTRNQIVAAIFTFALLLVVIFSAGLLENLVNNELMRQIFSYMNVWTHMDELAKGIVDSRRLVYYLSTTVFFLALTAQALEAKKWR